MLKERKDISDEYKWNLCDMYSSNEEVERDFEEVGEMIKNLGEYKGRLGESEDVFKEALSLMEESSRKLSNVYTFSHMKSHEDTRINENQAYAKRADLISTELGVATSFIVPEILSMDDDKLNSYMNSDKLSHYKKYLEDIVREKPHVLSEREEEILAHTSDLSDTAENTYEMLAYADMKFPKIRDEKNEEVELTHFNYSLFIKSKDRRVRREAFEAEFGTYESYKNTFASTLYSAIKSEIFYSKMRKYPSALESSLFSDDISVDVYDNLIKSVHENIPPLDRYLDIKKRALNLDELHMYDLYVPLAEDFAMDISFEQAKRIVMEALKPLGDEYLSIIQKAFDEKWIDVYENEGKKGGAYSWGSYDSHPYILMSYKNDLNSLFTLIHELGHSVHSYYSKKTQPYLYSGYKIFVAEVASTVNETLLINYLLNKSNDKKEKIYLLNYYLEQFRTTVYRQTLFAEFEKITHERVEAGQPLTAQEFSEIYYELNEKYYGKNAVVDKEYAIEWARIPHFYTNFYVYKYATGFSAASALVDGILNEGEKAVNRYIEFLKSGGSEYPLVQLKKAGVDMSKKESVDKALKVFADQVDKLDKLIG